jgi:peptidoglycan/LPS O-acetylase OafA/YrhL
LASKLAVLKEFLARCGTVARLVSWGAAIGILTLIRSDFSVNSFATGLALIAAGFAAITITALCITENLVTKVLETAPARWLGRVSYSLYLIHLPVLLAVFHSFPGNSYLLNACLSIALALVSAELMHRVVEVPSMAAGRILAAKMEKRLSHSNVAFDPASL